VRHTKTVNAAFEAWLDADEKYHSGDFDQSVLAKLYFDAAYHGRVANLDKSVQALLLGNCVEMLLRTRESTPVFTVKRIEGDNDDSVFDNDNTTSKTSTVSIAQEALDLALQAAVVGNENDTKRESESRVLQAKKLEEMGPSAVIGDMIEPSAHFLGRDGAAKNEIARVHGVLVGQAYELEVAVMLGVGREYVFI
jgi:hypothetical protein